ncbi:flagellar basal body-associated FliL family protein [Parvibium lacunae]|uniref:flagellar basal body-associated FliL family protein n=1 Tax=Parvibium lacunae TaxID=1888893 RepID=UPI001314CA60|nr:flagellar basal body-associated FliL family protein [Parvibium lacunae]
MLLAVVLLSPALIGGFWWVRENPVSIPELKPNLPPAPGFLDVGLLKREIITGDIVQVNIVIRTETKADAELLKHHLNDLRRAAIDIVGRQYGKEIAEYEGKRDLSRTLKIGFQEVIDRDRADLIKGVVFTDFLIIQ